MIKFSFFLVLVFIFMQTSCVNSIENDQIPNGILNEEKFAKVLADFALAESASNLNIKNIQVQKTDSVYAFDPLAENNVRKSQYDSSILFYTSKPELLKKIYENVLVKLSELQANRNITKVDSLSK